jgi:hypothetical protein
VSLHKQSKEGASAHRGHDSTMAGSLQCSSCSCCGWIATGSCYAICSALSMNDLICYLVIRVSSDA